MRNVNYFLSSWNFITYKFTLVWRGLFSFPWTSFLGHFLVLPMASRMHMSAGAPHSDLYTRTGWALSWNLPRGFRVASACLPGDPGDSRQLPDQFHVGSSLAPDVFGTVRVLSGRCPEHSRSCPQCRSLQDRLRKTRKPWRQAGCPDDVRTTKFISASKFFSGPKSRRGKSALSRRRRNARKCSGAIKTVRVFQECADRLPNHADL